MSKRMNGNALRAYSVKAALLAAIAAPSFALAVAADGTLVTLNDNGFWCWYQDERVIIDPNTNQMLVTSIASGDGVGGAARDGNVEIVSYNLSTNAISAPVSLINFSYLADDHNVPAMMIRPDGRYAAVYAAHQNDSLIRSRISTNPGDISSWNAEQTLTVTSNQGTTYANVFRMANGVTYNFYRGNNYDPHVLTSTDDGATFSYTGHLLMDPANGSGARPYVKYASNGVDKIYFSTSTGHPRDSNTGVYAGYLSTVNNHVYTLSGTDLGALGTNTGTAASASAFTPVLPANTVVNGTTRTHVWTTDVALDSAGNPYMGFTSRVNSSTSDHRFYYARWNGTSMVTNEVARAGGYLYSSEPDYTGLMALSTNDPNTLYISTKIDPRDTTGNTTTGKYEIYRGFTTDLGATWAWVPITTGSAVDNLRPTVPTWNGTQTALLWFQGTYTTYQHAQTAVVAKFYTGNNGQWTNTNGGTWTSTANWNDSRVGEGMSYIADFSTLDITGNRTVTLSGSKTVGNLTFGDTNTATPGTWTVSTPSAATLTLDNGVSAPVITVKNGTATLATPVAGSQGFTKQGAGTLVLAATNSLSGDLNIYNGTVSVSSVASGIGSSGTINLGSAAGVGTLRYTGTGETTARTLYQSAGAAPNGGTIDMSGTGTLRFTAASLNASQYQPHTLTLQGSTTGVGQIDSIIRDGSATNITSLLKQGSGTWVLAGANTYTGTTAITGGTLRATPAAYNNLLTNAGGVDLAGSAGTLILDYTGTASPVATVKSILSSGYANSFASGQLRSTDLGAGHTIGYSDNGANAVAVRVTLAGDADLDGDVDFNDFLALQANFGNAATRFDQGNFNYDNVTDFNDFLALQANFGSSMGGDVAVTDSQVAALTAFAATVPEPGVGLLAGVAALVMARRRNRFD
ncbi:MAG: BNR-4 repeat-containing protein [Tepidisphaeraceae bacterium]